MRIKNRGTFFCENFWKSIGSFLRNNQQAIEYLLVGTILTAICTLILWNANFIFEMFWADDYMFVSTTAVGRPSHAWTGMGRFNPLGQCDYSILLAIPYGTTVIAHFLYNCATMVTSSLLFFFFLKKLMNDKSKEISWIPIFCMLILFSISSFILIHISCIYPERPMFLMLSIFLFFYCKAANESQKLLDYMIAFIGAAYATYLKEPIFGLWIIFAVSNLIFGKLSDRNRKFNYALLINSGIWISIYTYRTIFIDRTIIDGGTGYGGVSSDNAFNIISNFITYFNKEPILYIILVIAFIRFITILKDRNKYHFIVDPALFSGLGYAFSYVIIGTHFNISYYYFPTVLLGIPAFALILKNLKHNSMRYIFIFAAILCSIYSANQSFAWVCEVMRHRYSDPPIFMQLIEESKNGKKILWVTEKGKEAAIANSRELDQMKFRRYQIFLDYYGGYRGEEHFPFTKTSDYSKINKNTIIMCSKETLESEYCEEIMSQIEKEGLQLSHSNKDIGVEIFKAE